MKAFARKLVAKPVALVTRVYSSAFVQSRIAALSREASAILGLGLLTYGIWQIHQPSALVVAGGMLIADRIATTVLLARKPHP